MLSRLSRSSRVVFGEARAVSKVGSVIVSGTGGDFSVAHKSFHLN